jgi:hypothetical protein
VMGGATVADHRSSPAPGAMGKVDASTVEPSVRVSRARRSFVRKPNAMGAEGSRLGAAKDPPGWLAKYPRQRPNGEGAGSATVVIFPGYGHSLPPYIYQGNNGGLPSN